MGSGGAYEISQRMTALIGWAGTSDFRDPWVYDQAADTYALDPAMAARLRQANPEAFRNVVAQERIRTALLLLAVDPGLCWVVITGRRSTAKTVMARTLHALLPPIRVIRHSCAQADPAAPWDWDDATVSRWQGSAARR
ncbi:MAG: cobaltochelatase subunit CobN [Prochlorococcaceae cyanobacterium]